MQFEIRPSVLVFFALMMWASSTLLGWPNGVWAACLVVASLLLHEAAHVLFALWYGVTVKRIGISWMGAYNVRDHSRSMGPEAVITLAGPLMNIFLFIIFRSMPGDTNAWIAACNLILGITNLVPVGPTDGARLRRLIATALRSPA